MSRRQVRRREVYRFRLSYILRFLMAMLLGQKRDLGPDIEGTLMAARPQPRVIDAEKIPTEGSFVFVANHYERPGLKVWWGGMLATNAIFERRKAHRPDGRPSGRALHWLMTSEWYNYRLAGIIPVPVWFLRWLFRRVAHVYSLIIVPRSPERVAGRAAAMRSIMDVVERDEPIGLFPEGVGGELLIEAMPGTGLFLHSLSRRGVPVLPAGICEEDGALTVRFGPPFFIELPEGTAKEDRDRLAREQVMARIGRLLPSPMWGPYTLAIEALLARSVYII